MGKRTVILGASNKPARYAYKALKELMAAGHEVVPVNPALKEIEGVACYKALGDVAGPVDTVTLYVGPERLASMVQDVIRLRPRRIISNPGTELDAMSSAAQKNGIEYVEGCTLVMLRTGGF